MSDHIAEKGHVTEREALRNALTVLVANVEAHQQYWARVDWASDHCERRVIDALIVARKVLAKGEDVIHPPNACRICGPNESRLRRDGGDDG